MWAATEPGNSHMFPAQPLQLVIAKNIPKGHARRFILHGGIATRWVCRDPSSLWFHLWVSCACICQYVLLVIHKPCCRSNPQDAKAHEHCDNHCNFALALLVVVVASMVTYLIVFLVSKLSVVTFILFKMAAPPFPCLRNPSRKVEVGNLAIRQLSVIGSPYFHPMHFNTCVTEIGKVFAWRHEAQHVSNEIRLTTILQRARLLTRQQSKQVLIPAACIYTRNSLESSRRPWRAST